MQVSLYSNLKKVLAAVSVTSLLPTGLCKNAAWTNVYKLGSSSLMSHQFYHSIAKPLCASDNVSSWNLCLPFYSILLVLGFDPKTFCWRSPNFVSMNLPLLYHRRTSNSISLHYLQHRVWKIQNSPLPFLLPVILIIQDHAVHGNFYNYLMFRIKYFCRLADT